MKKFLVIAVVMIMSLTTVGCGKSDDEISIVNNNEATTDSISENTTETIRTKNDASTESTSETELTKEEKADILFATTAKTLILNKDMAGLADITTFPVEISSYGTVATKEDFAALSFDSVFNADFSESISLANPAKLMKKDGLTVVGEENNMYFTYSTTDGVSTIISYNN